MKTTWLWLFLFIVLNSNGFSYAQDNKTVYSYAPAVVQLNGMLQQATYYGPPNYGNDPKHDSKEIVYVIILEQSIDIQGRAQSDFDVALNNLKKVQIVPRGFDKQLKSLLNQKVQVSGKLFGAQTGHHHTAALIQLEGLVKIK